MQPEQSICRLLRDQPFIPQGPEEALALLNVRATQVALIVDEIVHQVVVFRSNQVAPCIVWESTLRTSQAPYGACPSPEVVRIQ